MDDRQIVGITGFARAGKTELLKHMVHDYGYRVLSPSQIILEHLTKSTGRTVFSRNEMREMGHSLRESIGPDYVIKAADQSEENRLVIDGVRNLTAFRSLKSMGGLVIGLVARPEVRYARALESGDHKQSPVSIDAMVAEELQEMNSLDRNGMHILPILWSLEPNHIIDTSDMSIAEVCEHTDRLLEPAGILPSPTDRLPS